MTTGLILWVCSVLLILLLVWGIATILTDGCWEDEDDDWH